MGEMPVYFIRLIVGDFPDATSSRNGLSADVWQKKPVDLHKIYIYTYTANCWNVGLRLEHSRWEKENESMSLYSW